MKRQCFPETWAITLLFVAWVWRDTVLVQVEVNLNDTVGLSMGWWLESRGFMF